MVATSGFSQQDLIKLGPDELTRKRQLAEALLARAMGQREIDHPLQGVAQLAEALVGGLKERRAEKALISGKEGADTLFSAGMGMAPQLPEHQALYVNTVTGALARTMAANPNAPGGSTR